MATQEAVEQSNSYREEYICTIYRMVEIQFTTMIKRTDWIRINFKKIPRVSFVKKEDLTPEILAELETGKEVML